MTFLLCDPGWCVHTFDVQNKCDDNTRTYRTHTLTTHTTGTHCATYSSVSIAPDTLIHSQIHMINSGMGHMRCLLFQLTTVQGIFSGKCPPVVTYRYTNYISRCGKREAHVNWFMGTSQGSTRY